MGLRSLGGPVARIGAVVRWTLRLCALDKRRPIPETDEAADPKGRRRLLRLQPRLAGYVARLLEPSTVTRLPCALLTGENLSCGYLTVLPRMV